MTLSLRLNENEAKLIQSYAQLKQRSVSDVMRTAILEQIDYEFDLHAYDEGMKEYNKNPETVSHEVMLELLGLSDV